MDTQTLIHPRKTCLLGIFVFLFGSCAFSEPSQYCEGLLEEFQDVGEGRLLGGMEENAILKEMSWGEMDTVEGLPFESVRRFQVKTPPKLFWNTEFSTANRVAVEKGDSLLVVFWARGEKAPQIVDDGDGAVLQLYLRSKSVGEYHKGRVSNFYDAKMLSDEWKRYYVKTGPLAYDFPVGSLEIVGMLGHKAQTIEIGGLAWIAFPEGSDLERMPRPDWNYEGRSPDAAWRVEAAERIERYRKGTVSMTVLGQDGEALAGIPVQVRMKKHAFRFGVAVNVSTFHGKKRANTPVSEGDLKTYREISSKYFNSITLENAMKWQQIEWHRNREWKKTLDCLAYYSDQGKAIRGHVLVWPSYFRTPENLRSRAERSPEFLQEAVLGHIEEMGKLFGPFVTDWDVTNETLVNRDFMDVLGPSAMVQWYQAVRRVDPNASLTLNEPQFGPKGGMEIGSFPSNLLSDKCRGWVDYLLQQGAPLDSLGSQAHGGRVGKDFGGKTGPEGLWAYFDYLSDRYGLRLQYTELDINIGDPTDPEQQAYQADKLRDTMIIAFSHPAFDAITQWGFWAGSHHAPAAALWAEDWTLRPVGQRYLDLVFHDWWTDLDLITDEEGRVEFSGFRGEYDLVIGKVKQPFELLKAEQALTVKLTEQAVAE